MYVELILKYLESNPKIFLKIQKSEATDIPLFGFWKTASEKNDFRLMLLLLGTDIINVGQ